MSSNDQSKPKQDALRSKDAPVGNAPKSDQFFDIDPAEIDRYLGGRDARQSASTPGGSRSRSAASGTARQLEQLQQSVNRAARTRRNPAPLSRPSLEDDESAGESDVPEGTSNRQTAYAAAPDNLRANRRKRVKWRDPYVDEPETFSDFDDQSASWTSTSASTYLDEEEYGEGDTHEEPDQPVPPSTRRSTRQPAVRVAKPTLQRPNIQRPTLPPAIARADLVNDAPALGFIGVSCLSLLVMAIIVANRVGTLNPVISTHMSASGIAEGFASRTTVWHLPLMAAMLTLMNLVAAWFVSPLDRFASRFLLATSLIAQFVVWVALLRILW